MISNFGGFPDDRAGAVIDEEIGTDFRSRMQVHAGAAVGPFGHESGEQGDLLEIQFVGHSLDRHGFHARVGEDDFVLAQRGGISVERGFGIGLEQFPDRGQSTQKPARQVIGQPSEVGFPGFLPAVVLQTFVDFVLEPALKGVHQIGGHHLDLRRMNGSFVEESGKQEPQEIHGDGCNRALGGKVDSVQVVDASRAGV